MNKCDDYFDTMYKGAGGFAVLSLAVVGSTGLEAEIMNIDLNSLSVSFGALIGAGLGYASMRRRKND